MKTHKRKMKTHKRKIRRIRKNYRKGGTRVHPGSNPGSSVYSSDVLDEKLSTINRVNHGYTRKNSFPKISRRSKTIRNILNLKNMDLKKIFGFNDDNKIHPLSPSTLEGTTLSPSTLKDINIDDIDIELDSQS